MPLTRREFLWTATASGLVVPFGVRAQPAPGPAVFQHGVASGDPLADRVMIWTRVTPSAGATTKPVTVRWQVASDAAMKRTLLKGSATTGAERDFTVKVDVGGLQPGRTYYYAFDSGDERSPVGRTKTLPSAGITHLSFAVVSCANYPAGYFNVYRCLANRPDLDAIIHVGDYIYEFADREYGEGALLGRIPVPAREAVALADYRSRYATYRTDPDLQEAHRLHPFIAVWDDHELANDAWAGGAGNHTPGTEGDWAERRAGAYRAYLEWLPIREVAGPDIRLYRTFRYGGLADVIMIDTRGLRDKQVATDNLTALVDPARTLMGPVQEAWLHDQLRESVRDGAAWRLLGQQVLFSRLTPPGRAITNADAWDGYQAERQRLLDLLTRESIRDVAILTGDMHSSWGLDVTPDPWSGYQSRSGQGSVAVELVTPAISSPPLFGGPQGREMVAALRLALPHLKFLDGVQRGYVLLDLTRERLRADWWFAPSVIEQTDREEVGASLVCERGATRLVKA